jgi:hypothetical protein
MSKEAIILAVDGILRPLGFQRRSGAWNRRLRGYIDVIELQTRDADKRITINAGVLDPRIYEMCWGMAAPKFVGEPHCTVRVRACQPGTSKEAWWRSDSAVDTEEILDQIRGLIIPFIERMHSPQAMEQQLSGKNLKQSAYPPPIIYLAILRHNRGDDDGAYLLLDNLKKKTLGQWKSKIDQIKSRLAQ